MQDRDALLKKLNSFCRRENPKFCVFYPSTHKYSFQSAQYRGPTFQRNILTKTKISKMKVWNIQSRHIWTLPTYFSSHKKCYIKVLNFAWHTMKFHNCHHANNHNWQQYFYIKPDFLENGISIHKQTWKKSCFTLND